MKKLSGLVLLFAVALVVTACAWLQSPQAKAVERQILSDVQIACVLEHTLFPVPDLEQACSIEHTFAPAIETLLAAHKAAARREHVGACPCFDCDPWDGGGSDGGHSAPDAGKDARR